MKIYKLISITLTISLLWHGVVWPTPGYSSTLPRTGQPSANFYIPEQYGRIEELNGQTGGVPRQSRDRTNGQTVILIKDAHCNYEAQTNIAKILEALIRDYKVDLVCVEGASGPVDTSIFQSMPDKKARENASDKFVKKGYLTASEALSISRAGELPFTIWGVEDTKLYVDDFKLFRQTINGADEAGRFIKVAGDVINKLKGKIYNPELKEFDEKLQKYKGNELSLTEWIKYIRNQKPPCTFMKVQGSNQKNFNLVLKAIDLEEDIDFKAVENERASLIKELEKNLPKDDIRKLVEKSLLFKLGKISSLDYYTYLEQYTNQLNLKRYICLVKLQSEIDEDALFRELDDIEDAVSRSLFRDNIEGTIYSIDKKINILDKLFRLQMNRDELEYYSKHRLDFSITDIANFFIIQAGAQGIEVPLELKEEKFLKQAQEHAGPAEEFYRLAFRRDEVLVNNLLKKMGNEQKSNAVIVAGGFHADGIKEKLKGRDVQCIEITPAITKTQKDNPYLKLMMDEDLNIEALLPENIGLPLMTGQRGMRVFPERWRELAKQVISGTNLTIAQLEKELAGTDMAATFEELKKFAGVVSRKEPTTVGELKEAIKPESIISWISKLTDEEIENYGGDAFVEYLLLWLERSCDVIGEDYREALEKLEKRQIPNRIKEAIASGRRETTTIRQKGSAILNGEQEIKPPEVPETREQSQHMESLAIRKKSRYYADNLQINGQDVDIAGVKENLRQISEWRGDSIDLIDIALEEGIVYIGSADVIINNKSVLIHKMKFRDKTFYISADILGKKKKDITGIVKKIKASMAELRKEGYNLDVMLPEGIFIHNLSGSRYLFENHTRDGFIGINQAFVDGLNKCEDAAQKASFLNLLQAGLEHELLHECGITDEAWLKERDARRIATLFGDSECIRRLFSSMEDIIDIDPDLEEKIIIELAIDYCSRKRIPMPDYSEEILARKSANWDSSEKKPLRYYLSQFYRRGFLLIVNVPYLNTMGVDDISIWTALERMLKRAERMPDWWLGEKPEERKMTPLTLGYKRDEEGGKVVAKIGEELSICPEEIAVNISEGFFKPIVVFLHELAHYRWFRMNNRGREELKNALIDFAKETGLEFSCPITLGLLHELVAYTAMAGNVYEFITYIKKQGYLRINFTEHKKQIGDFNQKVRDILKRTLFKVPDEEGACFSRYYWPHCDSDGRMSIEEGYIYEFEKVPLERITSLDELQRILERIERMMKKAGEDGKNELADELYKYKQELLSKEKEFEQLYLFEQITKIRKKLIDQGPSVPYRLNNSWRNMSSSQQNGQPFNPKDIEEAIILVGVLKPVIDAYEHGGEVMIQVMPLGELDSIKKLQDEIARCKLLLEIINRDEDSALFKKIDSYIQELKDNVISMRIALLARVIIAKHLNIPQKLDEIYCARMQLSSELSRAAEQLLEILEPIVEVYKPGEGELVIDKLGMVPVEEIKTFRQLKEIEERCMVVLELLSKDRGEDYYMKIDDYLKSLLRVKKPLEDRQLYKDVLILIRKIAEQDHGIPDELDSYRVSMNEKIQKGQELGEEEVSMAKWLLSELGPMVEAYKESGEAGVVALVRKVDVDKIEDMEQIEDLMKRNALLLGFVNINRDKNFHAEIIRYGGGLEDELERREKWKQDGLLYEKVYKLITWMNINGLNIPQVLDACMKEIHGYYNRYMPIPDESVRKAERLLKELEGIETVYVEQGEEAAMAIVKRVENKEIYERVRLAGSEILTKGEKVPDELEECYRKMEGHVMFGVDFAKFSDELIKDATEILKKLEPTKEGAGQIGKKAEKGEVIYNSEGNPVSFKVRGREGTILLDKKEVDFNEKMTEIGKLVDSSVVAILGELFNAYQSTGAGIYSYGILAGDLFGFAESDDSKAGGRFVALHETIADNPIVLFHEIGEYLLKVGILVLELSEKEDEIKVIVNDKQIGISIKLTRKDAIKQARKIRMEPAKRNHYLLRALQRQILGANDSDFTLIIKAEQFLRGIAQDKWNEKIKKDALLAAKSLYLAGVFTKGSLDDMKNLFETITENAGKPVRIADAFIGLKELAEAVNSINDDIREEARDVVLNIRLLTLIAKNHGGVTENVYWILKELVLIINSMDIEGRKGICGSVLNLDLLMKIAADSGIGFYRYNLFYNFIKETAKVPPSVSKIILSRTLLEEIALNIKNADTAYDALKALAEKGTLSDDDLGLLIKIAQTGAVTIFKALQICADRIASQKELLQLFNLILEQDEKDILTAYLICLIYDGEDFEAIRMKIEGVVKERDIRGAVLHNLEVMEKKYYSSRKGLKAGDAVKTNLDLLVNNIYALVLFYRVSNKVFRTNSVFDTILMKIILRSNIHADYEAANADFLFGQKFISEINVEVLFMVTVHEIMHNVLSEHGIETEKGPEKASIHKFLSDIAAFSMAVYMGGNIDEFKEAVKYADMLKAAEIFGGKPLLLGGHIPARAQLGKLFIWFKEINAERRRGGKKSISLGLHWKDILEIGVDIIIANKELEFNELVLLILKKFGDFLKSQKEIGTADVRGKGSQSSIIPPSSITIPSGEPHDLVGVQILDDSEFPREPFISLISKIYKRLRVVKKEDKSLVLEGYNTRTKKMERLTLGITPAGIKGEEIVGLSEDGDCRNLVEAIISCANQDIVSYQELHEDLFGFASSEYNLIALHKSLAGNPIAIFHEIGEYLIKMQNLKLRIQNDRLVITVKDKEYTLILNEEALAIANKGPENPHYLLRALQRQVFGDRDRDLTAIIKAEQLIKEIGELEELDGAKRRELVDRISGILDKIKNGQSIEEDELNIDVNILLETDLDKKFEIVAQIARFVNTVVPKGYKGNKGLIVAAIEAEILKVIKEGGEKDLVTREEELLVAIRKIAMKKGIAPDMITSVYDMLRMGIHIIVMDPRQKMAEIDPAYIELIDLVAEITGVERSSITKAFADGYVKGYLEVKGESVPEQEKEFIERSLANPERRVGTGLQESAIKRIIEKIKSHLNPRIENGRFDLDLNGPSGLDFRNGCSVLQDNDNDVGYYLSTYDVVKEDIDKLWGAVPEEKRELARPTVVATDIRRFLGGIKRKGEVIEIIQSSVGLRYVLEKVGQNGYVALHGCGEDTSIIREAIDRAMPREIADRIILLKEKPDAQNITALAGEIQGKVKGANILWPLPPSVAEGVVNANREAVVNNQLKVVGIEHGSALHAELLFGFLYAGINLFKDGRSDTNMIDTLLQLLKMFGCANLDDIGRNLSVGALYFTVRLIRIKDTLEEFQNRITIEISV